MKTRMPEDDLLVDRFNSKFANQGISAHFEERPSATQAVIDDYRKRAAAASSAGLPVPEPPPGIDPSRNASNTILVVERRRPGGSPDEVKRTEFAYDSYYVNAINPETGALVRNPVLTIKNTLMVPSLVVNSQDLGMAPYLAIGPNAHRMEQKGDQYFTAHQSASNLLSNIFGDQEVSHGFSSDAINKRWEEFTAHLPTSTNRDYRGVEGIMQDARAISGSSSMIQFVRGNKMSPSQWKTFKETLPGRGYAEGPMGSTHADFSVSDEYERRKNQNVVLATFVNSAWQSAVPGTSQLQPGGDLFTSYRGSATPAGEAKAIAGSVKRENLRDRQGFIPDNTEVVEFPGVPNFRGFLTVTQLGIKRVGDGGVDEAGAPVPEGRIEYRTPAGGGQGLGSRNLFQVRGVNQVGDNYFEPPRDQEVSILNFRTLVGTGDEIPYTGGVLARWGRGGMDRQNNPTNTVEFDRMGDMGGKKIVGQSISFGDDEQSAKFIKDLLGDKTPYDAAAIRSILQDKRSRDPLTPLGHERMMLERAAVDAINELQVKRDYYGDDGKIIPESDPRHAVEVAKARDKYRILYSAPGGKGGKTSFIVSAGYNSAVNSVKAADRKVLVNEIPTTPSAQKIIDQAGQAYISGSSAELPSLNSIERLVYNSFAKLHEDTSEKFQEDSSGTLQMIADVAAVSAYGPGARYKDALGRLAAGDASARDELTLSNAASGLKAIPVIEHTIDEIKNTPDAHILTLAGYWHLGETGKYGKYEGSERDPMNVGGIYTMLKRRFGTVENMMKADPHMISEREAAFFELMEMSPEIGGRKTYYQITPHVNVEPAGTRDTVNSISIEEIVRMSRDQSFQEYLNRGNMDEMSQAARIISTVVPGGMHSIEIEEEDLKTKTIPEYRQAEADDRFYVLREIYDAAREREEKRTGKKIGRYTPMRFTVSGYEDPKTGRSSAEQLVVASPYAFQGLERSAAGETLVRFVESIQASHRDNVIGKNIFDLHNQHMQENIEYASSPGGQKALQNFAGPVHGVAMRYGFSPIVQGNDVLIGPHHAAIYSPLFGIDDPREFWRRLMAGEEFWVDLARFPQAMGKQGRGLLRAHPDFMGPPSISQQANLKGLGDFDGDLDAFIAAQKRIYYERGGKKYSENAFIPGMSSNLGQGAADAASLSALASMYNPDELERIINNARKVVGDYMENEMARDRNFLDAFEAQYGIKFGGKGADPDALAAAKKVEIDRLSAQALVHGMDEIGEGRRRYIVPGLDVVFAGKAQRVETEMDEKLLSVDMRKSEAESKKERLEQIKKATRAVAVKLSPQKSGALVYEEQIAKREMGIYTPISALQGVMSLDQEHLNAVEEAAREKYGPSELEKLAYASNPGGWHTASYSGQAIQALSLNYQRALDMLFKPDSLKRYSKDFFVTDIAGWKGNENQITENAMMALLQTEEISPLAFSSVFSRRGDKQHIKEMMEQSEILKEKIRASKEASASGKGEEMSFEQIKATKEWQAIARGRGLSDLTRSGIGMGMIDSAFTRMFEMQSIHNTLKGINEGRYSEESSAKKKAINEMLKRALSGPGGIESTPEKFAQFLETAGRSRNRNLVGFLMSSFRSAAGLPENYRDVLSGAGMSLADIAEAMHVPIRLDESPSRLEQSIRGISRDSFNEIAAGNIQEAWESRLKENFDLLPMGPANQRTRFGYFRSLGLPVQWAVSEAGPRWSNRASMRARPSGLDVANFDLSRWTEFVFGDDASVYALGAAHGSVNQALMRSLVGDQKNPGLVDADALSYVDADLFTKNKYSVTVQRNTALVGGYKYEKEAIRDLIDSEASDPNMKYLPMGGYGFFAGDKVSGVDLAGSADLFQTIRDPKTGQMSVTIFDLKGTRLKGAIRNSSWTIPGREYSNDDPITGAELKNVVPSSEFGPYTIQEEAYKYLAIAQTMENRRKLAEQISEKRRKEHEAREDAAEAAAAAAGTSYTRTDFVAPSITEKDFDLTGEHSTSDYAKMINKWAEAIASARTGIQIPFNEVLRREWEARGDDKALLAEKSALFPHVQEMFQAISEGRIKTGGVIIPNENEDGTFVVDRAIESDHLIESRRLHEMSEDSKEAAAKASGSAYTRVPFSGDGFSITPIVGGKHAIVSTRHMESAGPNSFQALLNRYPTATQNLLLKAGPYHLSMIAKSLNQVMKNRNVFMGLDRETGEVNSSFSDGSDLSALFSDQVRRMMRGGKTMMPASKSPMYEMPKGLEESAGVLGAIQQATGFSSRELAKMEHALRGYERTSTSSGVEYKKVGNSVIGDERSGPAILSELRSGSLTDAELREIVVSMATQRGSSASRTRTVTMPLAAMPRELPNSSIEWADSAGVKRSPLEVVAGSVREMLSPSGDTPAEQLAAQQKAFDVLIANNVFRRSDFSSKEWRNAYAEPDEKERVEKLKRMSGRLIAERYEGEYESISPPWATFDKMNPFGTSSSGGVYFRTGKNTTLYAVNPQIAGIEGGLDAAWMVTMRMMHAMTQVNTSVARGLKFGSSPVGNLDTIPKAFEDIKTTMGEVAVPTMPMERLVMSTAEGIMARDAATKGSYQDKLRQMAEQNTNRFFDTKADSNISGELRKYLNNDRVREMYTGIKAFTARPDHRGWYWDDHLRLMSALTDQTMQNIMARKGGGYAFDPEFAGFAKINPKVVTAMIFGHDLMKAQMTRRDEKIKDKRRIDYEDDKTPAMDLARDMGLSDEEVNLVGKYLTMMDAAKKGLSDSEIKKLPWEVRLMSTIDSVVHAAPGPRGFYNTYSSITWPSQNRGQKTRLLEIAEGNEKKMRKDNNKVLMSLFRNVTRRRGLFGRGEETTQPEIASRSEIIDGTLLQYDPRTKETHVEGVATDIVRSALLNIKQERDSHYSAEHEKRRQDDSYQIQTWHKEDLYPGDWLDAMLAPMPDRGNPLFQYDSKSKRMNLFKPKGKMHGGPVDKRELDIVGESGHELFKKLEDNESEIAGFIEPISARRSLINSKSKDKEMVGEFGQEIIFPGEDGELYVSPSSAIKRRDSEQYQSSVRSEQDKAFQNSKMWRPNRAGPGGRNKIFDIDQQISMEGWGKFGFLVPFGGFRSASERMLNIRVNESGDDELDYMDLVWRSFYKGQKKTSGNAIDVAKKYFGNMVSGIAFSHEIPDFEIEERNDGSWSGGWKKDDKENFVFDQDGKKVQEHNILVKSGNLNSLDALFTTFHEIGHFSRWKREGDGEGSEKKIRDWRLVGRRNDYARVLHDEASASLYALKHLKRILSKDQFSDAQQIAVTSLLSYEKTYPGFVLPDKIKTKHSPRVIPVWKPNSKIMEQIHGSNWLSDGFFENSEGKKTSKSIYRGWMPGSDYGFYTKKQIEETFSKYGYARAQGGPVDSGSSYFVGENAKETYESTYWDEPERPDEKDLEERTQKEQYEKIGFGNFQSVSERLLSRKAPLISSSASFGSVGGMIDYLRSGLSTTDLNFDVPGFIQDFIGKRTEPGKKRLPVIYGEKIGAYLPKIHFPASLALLPLKKEFRENPSIWLPAKENNLEVLTTFFHEYGHHVQHTEAARAGKRLSKGTFYSTMRNEAYANRYAMDQVSFLVNKGILSKDNKEKSFDAYLGYLFSYEHGLKKSDKKGYLKLAKDDFKRLLGFSDNDFTGRAHGGPVKESGFYVVGENNEEFYSKSDKSKKNLDPFSFEALTGFAREVEFGHGKSLSEQMLGVEAENPEFFKVWSRKVTRAAQETRSPFKSHPFVFARKYFQNKYSFDGGINFFGVKRNKAFEDPSLADSAMGAFFMPKDSWLNGFTKRGPDAPRIGLNREYIQKVPSLSLVATLFHEIGHYDESHEVNFREEDTIQRQDFLGAMSSEAYANRFALHHLENLLPAKEFKIARQDILEAQLSYEHYWKPEGFSRANGGSVSSESGKKVGFIEPITPHRALINSSEKTDREVVGEFGQEIISPGENGELYSVPNSAVKREDSEQMKANRRARDNEGFARARGGFFGKIGALVGEAGKEIAYFGASLGIGKKASPSSALTGSSSTTSSAATSVPTPASPTSTPSATTPVSAPSAPTAPPAPAVSSSSKSGTGLFGKIFGGRKSSGVSSSSPGSSSPAPLTLPVSASSLPGSTTKPSPTDPPKTADDIYKAVFGKTSSIGSGHVLAGHDSDPGKGVPVSSLAAETAVAIALAFKEAGIAFGGGVGGAGGLAGGSSVSKTKAGKWAYSPYAMRELFTREKADPTTGKGTGELVAKPMITASGDIDLGWTHSQITNLLSAKEIGTAEASGIASLQAIQQRGRRSTLEDLNRGVKLLEEWIGSAGKDSAESSGMIELLNRVKDMRSAKIASMGSMGAAFSMSYDEIKEAGEKHNAAFASDPRHHVDAKKAMNSFTEQLMKSTDFLKDLNTNLGEMVKTTGGAEKVYKELAANYERQKQWVQRAKEQGIGETEEGRKVLGAAEFELSVMEGQLQHGSDLYKEVASRHGEDFANRMVAEAKGGRSSRKGMLTAHFLHELNRAAHEAVSGALNSASHYAEELRAERGVLAPIQENMGQINERGLLFEAARDNWQRNIGANVSSALGGLYNMDSGVASMLRAGSQIAAPAMSAMMFTANMAQVAPGSISTKGILASGIATAVLGTAINAIGVSGDNREMASNDWIERMGGSRVNRDFLNATGHEFRKFGDLVSGEDVNEVAMSRDEMIRAKERLDSLRKQGKYDVVIPEDVYKQFIDGKEDYEVEAIDRVIANRRRIAAGVAPLETDLSDEDLKYLEETYGITEMQSKGLSIGTEGSILDYKKIKDAEKQVRDSEVNFSSARFKLLSRKNWEAASRELSADQVNVMAPFDSKQSVDEMMASANRGVSPVSLALWRDTFVGRPGQESYNQYRQYGLSLGLSDSQITTAAEYAQLYAGAPGTPIFSAAYSAFSDRMAYGEDIGQTMALGREIGVNTGNMSYLGDASTLIGRNFTGSLLSQEQLYGVASNTRSMNVGQVLSAFAPMSSMTFGQLQQAVRPTYMYDAMTPDIAQYQSNKAALIAASSTLETYNKLHGTNVAAPNWNLIDYGKVSYSSGFTPQPTLQQSYDAVRMQVRSENLPQRTYDDPNRTIVEGMYDDMTFATVRYGEQSRMYAEKLAKAPSAAEIIRQRNPLKKIARVTPGAHRAMAAFAAGIQEKELGSILGKAQSIFGDDYLNMIESLFKSDQTGTSVEAIARVAMGDQQYISGMNWNAASTELKAAFEGVGIVPSIDSTTGQPMFQASMHNARLPGSGPGMTTAVQSPTWNPKRGMLGWKSDLQRMGTVQGTRSYFDAQSNVASKSGMKTVWSSLGSSEKDFYSRLAAGDVMTRMVGGQETPIAGAAAFQAYAQYTAAQSQLASAGASIANLKAQREFDLNWSRPMEKYQREQKVAAMFGGKVDSPFGNGTLDFGKGRFAYQRMEMDIQKRDMIANFSQNMTRLGWQTEDMTRERGRQLVQADWQLQDLGFQRRGQLINREMQQYNFGFQKREMDIGKQAYREDFAYSRRMAQMQFGWQMEDADINIRRATGFERRQLIKQKEREVVSFNAQSEQAEKENKRQEDAFKRQEEKFEKEVEHYKKTIRLEDEQYDAALERFNKQQKWNEEDFNIRMMRNEQEKGWLAESFARQMERFNLEKEQFELDVKNQEKLAKDEKDYQEAAWKLADEIYKNNLAAAGAAAAAAKAAALAAEKMEEAAGDTQKGVEIMTRFFQDTRWSEVQKAMDKIIEMWKLINGGEENKGKGKGKEEYQQQNADGGYVDHRRSTLVGERGPEIITIDGKGRPYVIPNSAIPRGRGSSGGQNEVIHIHVMMDSNEIATYTADKAVGLASRNRRRAFNG